MVHTARNVIFSLAVVVILAAVTNALTNKNDDNLRKERVRRGSLPQQFRVLMQHLASLFGPGSPTYDLLRRLSNVNKAPMALTSKGTETVVVKTQPPRGQNTRTRCSPPCRKGRECCLLKPGASVATCQRNKLSGRECGWNHYSSSNPSTTTAIQQRTCPCLVGMACVSATERRNGVCTFF